MDGSAMDILPSRVFMNGNSQAVRIPAAFRLSTDRVQISRTPEGDLVIHPCPLRRGPTQPRHVLHHPG